LEKAGKFAAIFGTTSIFDLWSRPWRVVRLLEFLHENIPRKGPDSTTITCFMLCWMVEYRRFVIKRSPRDLAIFEVFKV